jgi:hypothetical protein
MTRIEIDVGVLRRLLDYDPETGTLTWRVRAAAEFNRSARRTREHACANWNSRFAGKPAGTLSADGYVYVRLLGRIALAHRAIFAIVTGAWPTKEIDHRDRDRSNNRWENLRPANSSQNKWNAPAQRNNTSGVKGVSLCRKSGKWRASIARGGRQKHLGFFARKEDAAAAYDAAAKQMFGDYACVA